MSSEIRVRFAPSPTGPLHIGGVRTALYNYLFARKHGGTFILRIEDTDQTRYVEGAEKYIIDTFDWCGITIDEGVREGGPYAPYRQSERKDIYSKFAEELVAKGMAYYAFDTPEELDALRQSHEKEGRTFIYNSITRGSLKNSLSLPENEWKEMIASGVPAVIRFMVPVDTKIPMKDIIRGDMEVHSSTLDDKVLFKADGMPTYHLANVVDDHLMKISHVIRGEEWLPSLPLHVMLYRAFGWNEPEFAHLPLLLKPAGKGKLSKRDGDKMGFPVFPLYWPCGETARGYREDGYFPDAFINMLALLGWNPGTGQEIFSMEQLAESFTLDRVGKSGSQFDPEKARWFNHQYMQEKPVEEIAGLFAEILAGKGKGKDVPFEKLVDLTGMVRERANLLPDLWEQADYFFEAPDNYDPAVVKKRWKENTPGMMEELAGLLSSTDDFSSAKLEEKVKAWITEKGYGMGEVMNVLRLLIVGASRGPHLFDILSWIGRDETVNRIRNGLLNIK